MYYLYIIYSAKFDQYYIGSTGNLEELLRRHNAGRSKATKGGQPWLLKYVETFESRSVAYQRELYIKKQKSRSFIIKLIHSA